MPDEGFKEKPWHWWLSRVGIPLMVAAVGVGGVLNINREKVVASDAVSAGVPDYSERPHGGHGPRRETYRIEEPSPTAVFNSITDNPVHGDERNFVQCRLSDEGNPTYRDDVPVQRGKTPLTVYAWIDNSSTRGDQKITGAHMRLIFAGTGTDIASINVDLSAENTISVWDGCRLFGTAPIDPSYVPGSAVFSSRDGKQPIRDAVIRGEAPLPGIRGNADGEIGGDSSNYGYIEFKVEAFG